MSSSEEDESLSPDLSPVTEEGEVDRNYVLELGDHVIIESEKHGFAIGTIYYRSGELLRLRPDNTSNILLDFPRVYEEGEEDRFAEDLGVTASYILEKRDTPAFVVQQDFRMGQLLQAFDDTKELQGLFEVTGVSVEEDSITIVNTEDVGDERVLNFDFTGIPLDQPFSILWRKGIATTAPVITPVPAEGQEVEGQQVEGEQAEPKPRDEEEDEEIQELGEALTIEYIGEVVLQQSEVYEEERMLRKVIPDDIQKSDAVNDFLNMLDPALQKDPKALRERRLLVETFHAMKQEIIEYNPDGSIYGPKATSPATFSDLIKSQRIPMGMPILDIKKRIFKDPRETSIKAEGGIDIETNDYIFIRNNNADIDAYNKHTSPYVSTNISTTQGDTSKLIELYALQQHEYEEFERPWRPSKTEGMSLHIYEDMPIFRSKKPVLDDATLPGYNANPEAKEKGADEPPYPIFGEVNMGLERALTTTYRRGLRGGKQMLLGEDSAILNYYLVFPPQFAANIGSTRSGSLALDTGRSLEPTTNMQEILEDLGGIPKVSTTNTILNLRAKGEGVVPVSVRDYIEGMNIQALGLGETLIPLEDYGISRMEFSTELMEVLDNKITAHQNQLISGLATLREENESIPEPEANPMLPLESPIFDVTSEPQLVDAKAVFEKQNPVLKASDIALTGYFLSKYNDYYQAVIGGQPEIIAKERNLDIKMSYIKSRKIEQQIATNKRESGLPPKPNRCEHVAKLNAIRKIQDEYDRYYLLAKFLAKYQGARKEGNWIGCRVCEENLMCVHERQQIKAFLNPKEKELVDKELKLNFSGGLFQGAYICRNCGQAMQELSYDTNIQFDDNGRPMVGRAVLEDKDKLASQDIEYILGMPLQSEDQFKFKSPEANKMYKVLRVLAERVGVFMDKERYEALIRGLDAYIRTSLPTVQQFNLQQEAIKAQKKKDGKSYTVKPYYPLLAKYTICAAAALVLIEIQTHIPEYKIHHTLRGCEPGFGGFPLSENMGDTQGLKYMACAILSVPLTDEPWSQARLSEGISAADKRQDRIDSLVKTMAETCIGDMLKDNLKLQQQLVDRRRYEEEKEGIDAVLQSKRLRDIVPKSFLPELMSPDVLKEGAIIPEAAASEREKARAWILMAHRLARRFSKPVRGSFLSDITCCKASVQIPGTFWTNQADMPRFSARTIVPIPRPPAQQFHFIPRIYNTIIAEIPEDLTYRLFLKVCFTGPRIGLVHEPGLTNRCQWCGLEFGQHPSILNIEEKGRDIVEAAGVPTNMEAFQTLLDKVHMNNEVEPHIVGDQVTWAQTLEEFITMDPPPMDDWAELLQEMLKGLGELGKDEKGALNQGEILEKLSEFSDAARIAEQAVMSEITDDKFKNPIEIQQMIREIAVLEWHNFAQVLETYFIKPCKNILNNYDVNRLKTYSNRKFAALHMSHIEKMLTADSKVATSPFAAEIREPVNQFGYKKLEYFVDQISAITRFKHMIRPNYFVGRGITFKYIQQALLYGPISTLFNSSVIPPGYTGLHEEGKEEEEEEETDALSITSTVADSSLRIAVQIIGVTVQVFNRYQMNYNDKQIKEYIQAAAEKEKQDILSEFNGPGVTDEEKQLLKMQMNLGMGRFARGALNRVIKYHAEQYELEKADREELSGENIDVIYEDIVEEGGEEGANDLETGYGGENQDLAEFADEGE
jgi:hypothetical protein